MTQCLVFQCETEKKRITELKRLLDHFQLLALHQYSCSSESSARL